VPHPSRLLAKGARAQPFAKLITDLRTITPARRTLIHGANYGTGPNRRAKIKYPTPSPLKKHPPEGIRIGQASKNQRLTKYAHDIIGENNPSKPLIYVKKAVSFGIISSEIGPKSRPHSPSGGTCSNSLFQVF
jgi:hypothetical protein